MIFDGLSDFYAVAQTETLAAAAKALGISQATLNRRLAALEAELGVSLVDRGARVTTLTSAGELAFAAARRVRDVEGGVRARCRTLAPGQASCADRLLVCLACDSGDVRASATELDGIGDVRLEDVASVERALTMLDRHAADMVVAHAAAAHRTIAGRDGLCCESLARVAGAVAVDAAEPMACRGSVEVAELESTAFAVSRDAGLWEAFCALCADAGFEPLARRGASRARTAVDAEICLADSECASELRRHGLLLVPLAGVGFELVAVFRDEDPHARRVAEGLSERLRARVSRRAIPFAATFGSQARRGVALGRIGPERCGRMLAEVCAEPEVTQDLVLPDGTVVDKAYVALRNRLNRIGEGVGNDPAATSFQAVMALWSVDEARAVLKMPLFETFTAYDFSVRAGCAASVAQELLDSLARRSLLERCERGGVAVYNLPAWHSMWEASVLHYSPEFLSLGIMGTDEASGSQYPAYHVVPVGADVVAGGRVAAPYRDWEAYIASQSVICEAPCQCRAAERIAAEASMPDLGATLVAELAGGGVLPAPASPDSPFPGGEGHCLMFGETAQYWVSIGAGRYVSREDALALARRNVYERGAVPELSFSKDPGIMCFCRSEYCIPLSALRATGGSAVAMRNMTAYALSYDEAACARCGACVARCPMGAIAGATGSGEDDTREFAAGTTCIGCGQCVLACPTGARVLEQKAPEDVCDLPESMSVGNLWRSVDRMARGCVEDFTGTRIEG